MLITKRPFAALAVLAFFSIAMLCAESYRSAAQSYVSINSRAAEKGRAPSGQRKALKRTVYVEDSAPPSGNLRSGSRYLSSKERRLALPIGSRELRAFGIAPAQKVSTNLLLSVLNL